MRKQKQVKVNIQVSRETQLRIELLRKSSETVDECIGRLLQYARLAKEFQETYNKNMAIVEGIKKKRKPF